MTLCLNEIVPLLNKFLTLCVCRVSNNEIVFGSADEYMNTSLPNDDRFIYCCQELLVCISSMFSWAPTNDNIMTSEFFNNIFELCMYNSSEKFINIHIAALMTISELFYLQKPLPQPQIQANGITELIQQSTLINSLEEYQDKLTELLKLFLTQQWTRCVHSKDFPTKEFLLYLFNFTFIGGISALTFTERLSVWKPIIQSFNDKAAGRHTETIVQLILNVFKRMQFQHDNELDLLDTEELDENMLTELQHFLNQCIEIVCTAAEVEPCKIFDLIYYEFNREDGKLKEFIALMNSLPDFTKDTATVAVNVDDLLRNLTHEPSKAFYFHCLIRDLSSLLQTITQLSSVVMLMTEERSNSISIVVRGCIYAFKLTNRKKLYFYNMGNQSVTTDLVELQAQLLTSVRSLLLLKSDVYEDCEEVSSLMASVAQVLLPPRFGCEEPLVVTNSSAQLMLTITSGIRPNFALKQPAMQSLLQSNLEHQQDKHVRLSIKRIVFNSLLLPYNKIAINQVEDQEYEERSQLLQQYVGFISSKFLAMDLTTESVMLLELTKAELSDYEELLTVFEDTNTISKQMLLVGLQKVIHRAIELFQKFAKNPGIYSTIVNFFLGVVRCLQLQWGNENVMQIIRMFLQMATVSNGNVQALNKLLQMLHFIVQQSGSAANMLMSDILKLTLDEMLPLERNQSADISVNLYTLFDAILQNHWNYFQKTQTVANGRSNQEDLLKIFTAFGQFLCNGTNSQDPNVIRIILSSLEKLNELWRMYDKVFFKNLLLKSFLCTLIRLVISPGGILFFDQITSIIFYMAERNKAALQESFVSIGYPAEVKIIQQICETCDLPTFSSFMEILIQDTIYSQFLQ